MNECTKERGDSTDTLIVGKLNIANDNLKALEERQAELEKGPRLDMAHLARVIESNIERQKSGLLEVKAPEKIRDALRILVGRIVAHPDGRLTYETNAVNLLTEAGGIRASVVAGA